MENNDKILENIVDRMFHDKTFRTALVRESHAYFFTWYFADYMKYKRPPFHQTFFDLSEQDVNTFLVVMGFRDCAKSAILNTSMAIWAITGKLKKKNVLIVSRTQKQARQHLSNVKSQLENNPRLKSDLGPFQTIGDTWGSHTLILNQYDACISAISMEEATRGIRHDQYRPDLILMDDIEDRDSVRTKEQRDKTWDWIASEIIPLADSLHCRKIILGNMLHEDSVMMRFKQSIEEKPQTGIFLRIPLIDDDGVIAWPGKYPDMKAIEMLKHSIPYLNAFEREYLLKLVPAEDQIVPRDWIQYCNEIPERNYQNHYLTSASGVDPASSLKSTADFSAIVSADLFGSRTQPRIYIRPHPVNKRMDGDELLNVIKNIATNLVMGRKSMTVVETNGFQLTIEQHLNMNEFPVEPAFAHTNKDIQLQSIAHLIKNGTVLFHPDCEDIINQIVNFGVEKYDDLLSAFCIVVSYLIKYAAKYGGEMGVSVGNFRHIYTKDEIQNLKPKSEKETKEEYIRRLQVMCDKGLLDPLRGF